MLWHIVLPEAGEGKAANQRINSLGAEEAIVLL